MNNHDDRAKPRAPLSEPKDDALLSWSELRPLIGGLSYPTIWRAYRQQRFPAPIKVSPGRVAWLRSEVQAWIADRVAARQEAA